MLLKRSAWFATLLFLIFIIIGAISLSSCSQKGPVGPSGPPGINTATLSGQVTNSLTAKPVAGVSVVTDPAITGVTITSDAGGKYSAILPIGVYSLSYQKTDFTTVTDKASLVAGQTATKNIVLQPVAPVIASAAKSVAGQPGAAVSFEASADILDDSQITSYQWTQIDGVPAAIDNPNSQKIQVTLGQSSGYKNQLVKNLSSLERFQVQAVNPTDVEQAETCTFQVTVTTSSGNYKATTTAVTSLPFALASGLTNVPAGLPVLLHGKTQASYNWIITTPPGSKTSFDDPNNQNPQFTPDLVGQYIITEKASGATINLYAGTWQGAITGIDSHGQPLADKCTTCHNGTIAPDLFTAWKASGHAGIFTQNLNTGSHYGEDCFSCHTVGFDKTVKNGGFDDATDYTAFLNSPLLTKTVPTNWTAMLQQFPAAARLANIQCENCHGPNNHASLHPDNIPASSRVSISAGVCAVCHAEGPRHARYLQWVQSPTGHASFDLAISEASVDSLGATAGSCGRCHSGQGFLAWIQQSDLTKTIQGAKGNATVDELKAMGLTADSVQPQTCAVCHDPHNEGTTSGKPNTATVRVTGNTPLLPAGFQALNVGRGAICIMCHNTRNGLHNDANVPTSYSVPHTAAQGDVLLGENAYLVNVHDRSPHASITDSYANCHMEATPPPAELSYQLSGTNHTFKASLEICSTCHSDALDAQAFQSSYSQQLDSLAQKMGQYLLNSLPDQVTVLDYTRHASAGKNYDMKSGTIVINKSDILSVSHASIHGQQSFIFKLKNSFSITYSPTGESPHSISSSQIQVQLGDITSDGKTAVIGLKDVLVEVGWNYWLIANDGSKGIHNPQFVDNVLGNSIDSLFPPVVPQVSE